MLNDSFGFRKRTRCQHVIPEIVSLLAVSTVLKLSMCKSASLNCLKGRQTVSHVVSHSKLPGDIVNEPVTRSEIPLKKIHIFTSKMSRGTQWVSCTTYVIRVK